MHSIVINSASNWYNDLYNKLSPIVGDEREKKSITRLILSHYINYTTCDYIASKQLSARAEVEVKIKEAIKRLNKGEPIQYILGHVEFMGLKLLITNQVLIPRVETEEMVASIINNCPIYPKSILDIGTGSGCIALSLKNHFKESSVYGLDISKEALDVAKNNNQLLGLEVNFLKQDILNHPLKKKWDLIVSNPPYIPLSEAAGLSTQVMQEPKISLFVPDDDPLCFYKKIGKNASETLNPGGLLYVETHSLYAFDVKVILESFELESINIMNDLQGKARWILAKKVSKPPKL